MPTAPSLADVKVYLGDDHSWTDEQITAALNSEREAQARVVRFPVDADPLLPDPYPYDLAEALCRRVAANLANRALPLGLQSSITEVGAGFARVGGGDREVRRLEAPFRRLAVG
jgi:hypothetical protein